jgi:hypothetical protein
LPAEKVTENFGPGKVFAEMEEVTAVPERILVELVGPVIGGLLYALLHKEAVTADKKEEVRGGAGLGLKMTVEIPKWDGKAASLTAHVQGVEEALKVAGVSDDGVKVFHFKASLPLEEQRRIMQTYSVVERASYKQVVERFVMERGMNPDQALAEAMEKATSYNEYKQQYGESLADYLLRVQRLLNHLAVVSDNIIDLTQLKGGAMGAFILRKGLREEIHHTMCATQRLQWDAVWDTLQGLAKAETVRRENAERTGEPHSFFAGGSGGQRRQQSPGRGDRRPARSLSPGARQLGEVIKKDFSKVKCYECGELGHTRWWAKCPKRLNQMKAGRTPFGGGVGSPRLGSSPGSPREGAFGGLERASVGMAQARGGVGSSPSPNIPGAQAYVGTTTTEPKRRGGGFGQRTQVGRAVNPLEPTGTAAVRVSLSDMKETALFGMAVKREAPVMIMDSGASILVVSRGYLERKGLSKHIVKGSKYEVSTADEVVTTSEKLVVDLCLPSEPRKHFFRAEVVVLPTANEIPFLFPMKLLEEWGMRVDFKTGETEWEAKEGTRKMRWERHGEQGKRCLISAVEVYAVVPTRTQKRGEERRSEPSPVVAAAAQETGREIGFQGNGRTPGWARGRM